MRNKLRFLQTSCILLLLASWGSGQSATGTLDVTARITPTGAKPEPVRQFTFYVLTKSYADIRKEASAQFPLDDRDTFVSNLKISPELKTWMKQHDVMDLTEPETDKLITPDDVMKIPEFFAAYERSNSGGVTKGLPYPKYKESDAQSNPAKYEKLHQEYLSATKKFIASNPSTILGMETELAGVNPKFKWDKALQEHTQKVAQLAPEIAQTKYLAGKGDTDLDGRLVLAGFAPGSYWVGTLGLDAAAGDRHLLWDVPVKIQPGQTTRIELSNINGTDLNSTRP